MAVFITMAYLAWSAYSARGAITSIAVLPFANETGDAGMEYLSGGISGCLTDKLAQLPQLKVIAHTSSSRYKDNNADLPEVARALGVQAIVVGRVARRGAASNCSSALNSWTDASGRACGAGCTSAAQRICQRYSQRLRELSPTNCASA